MVYYDILYLSLIHISLKVDTLSKNIDNKNKEIKELKKDNKHLEELVNHFKDLFDRLINFIKHKILGKDREREDLSLIHI